MAFSVQTTWVALLAVVVQVAAVYWYLSSARRSAERGRPWPRLKTLSFVVGALVAAYTVEGGIAHYSRSNFTVNVVRCLLLFDLVPPLLALASPLTLALRAASRPVGEKLLKVMESPVSRAMAHPALVVIATQAVLYIYFLTPLYAISEEHAAVGAFMDLVLVVMGSAYWWPIVGKDVMPRPLGYAPRFAMVFATVPLTIALGVGIASLTKPLYPAANTLSDTHTGGDVFWELAQVFVVLVLALLLVSFAYEEERRAVRADRQMDTSLLGGGPQAPDAGAGAGG